MNSLSSISSFQSRASSGRSNDKSLQKAENTTALSRRTDSVGHASLDKPGTHPATSHDNSSVLTASFNSVSYTQDFDEEPADDVDAAVASVVQSVSDVDQKQPSFSTSILKDDQDINRNDNYSSDDKSVSACVLEECSSVASAMYSLEFEDYTVHDLPATSDTSQSTSSTNTVNSSIAVCQTSDLSISDLVTPNVLEQVDTTSITVPLMTATPKSVHVGLSDKVSFPTTHQSRPLTADTSIAYIPQNITHIVPSLTKKSNIRSTERDNATMYQTLINHLKNVKKSMPSDKSFHDHSLIRDEFTSSENIQESLQHQLKLNNELTSEKSSLSYSIRSSSIDQKPSATLKFQSSGNDFDIVSAAHNCQHFNLQTLIGVSSQSSLQHLTRLNHRTHTTIVYIAPSVIERIRVRAILEGLKRRRRELK